MATAITEPPHLAADLKALYLSTVASQWRPLAEQAVRQRQAPADYLAQLVHLEVTARRERRIQRRIQDARFPMLQVFDCRFVAEAANVVFVGGVGTGKTHLSIALGMACCQRDYRVAVRDRGRAGHDARRGAAAGPAGPQARPARPLRRCPRRRAGVRPARQDRRRPACSGSSASGTSAGVWW